MSDAQQNTSATPIGFYGAETLESYQLAPGDYASYATSFTSSQGGNSEHLPSRLPPTPPRSLGGTKPDEDAAPVDAVNRRLSSSSATGASISSCLPGLIAFPYSSSKTRHVKVPAVHDLLYYCITWICPDKPVPLTIRVAQAQY